MLASDSDHVLYSVVARMHEVPQSIYELHMYIDTSHFQVSLILSSIAAVIGRLEHRLAPPSVDLSQITV